MQALEYAPQGLRRQAPAKQAQAPQSEGCSIEYGAHIHPVSAGPDRERLGCSVLVGNLLLLIPLGLLVGLGQGPASASERKRNGRQRLPLCALLAMRQCAAGGAGPRCRAGAEFSASAVWLVVCATGGGASPCAHCQCAVLGRLGTHNLGTHIPSVVCPPLPAT